MSGEMKTKLPPGLVSPILKSAMSLNGAGADETLSIRERGGFRLFRARRKPLEVLRIARFEPDLDARSGVLDPALEPELAGQSVDERPEPDPLDDAENHDGDGTSFSFDWPSFFLFLL